jgi:ergothioneine biosynthesis protein EgtB
LNSKTSLRLIDSEHTQGSDELISGETLAKLSARLHAVRDHTVAIAAPLSAEDCQVQSMPDASPIKWHLAHTTWFFETFLLSEFSKTYVPFDPDFKVLFNSYYNAVGAKHPRPERGMLSRPSLARVLEYRHYVDDALATLIDELAVIDVAANAVAARMTLGLNHEQQHQELMLTDVKHMLSINPKSPSYASNAPHPIAHKISEKTNAWISFAGGLVEIGHDASAQSGFAFDNESPRHKTFLAPFALSDRLVTNGDYLAFIKAGGYRNHALWLSEGFDRVQNDGWVAPLYWREAADGAWHEFTLCGLRALDLNEAVTHVSFFEADAYARWASARLPTEAEWEHAATHTSPSNALHELYDHVWQWTGSSYLGYPKFSPAHGAVGEYNGKFMCNQFVLRGSSVATPAGHARATYRNFFQPEKRWQFSGIRLARD